MELSLQELGEKKLRLTLDQLEKHASSVLSLTVQWKDIEDRLHCSRFSLEKRAQEVLSMEESILSRYRDLEQREKRVGSTAWFQELEERERMVELKEQALKEKMKDLEERERMNIRERKREIASAERSGKQVSLCLKDIEEREKRLELAEKAMSEKYEQNFKKILEFSKLIDDKMEQLEWKAERLEERSAEIENKEKLMYDMKSGGIKRGRPDPEASYDDSDELGYKSCPPDKVMKRVKHVRRGGFHPLPECSLQTTNSKSDVDAAMPYKLRDKTKTPRYNHWPAAFFLY